MEIAKASDGWKGHHFTEEKTKKGLCGGTGSFDFLTCGVWNNGIRPKKRVFSVGE